MKNRFSFIKLIGVIAIIAALLAGCGGGSVETPTLPPPTVNILLNPNISEVSAGQTVGLIADASGRNLQFKWFAARGDISATDAPSVVYTAPDTAGVDTVTVEVSSTDGTITRSVAFNVTVPPTLEPEPTTVPTPTPTFAPLVCNNRAVTKDVFPQLTEVNEQVPFYGPGEETRFDCQAVFDNFHNEPMAVYINYEYFENNHGFWGIGVPNEFPFDISSYKEVCFWAYAQKPNQNFLLKMKDTSPKEDGLILILEPANEWTPVCTELEKFSNLGIDLSSLENINLGFDQETDSVEIWVDDFELK